MTPHNANTTLPWPPIYRKIGGLHWLRLGRLRLAWCIAKVDQLRSPSRDRL